VPATKNQKTALISVSDKTGVIDFAKNLVKSGYRVISTGGTAKLLEKNKITVTKVSDVTKFPEILGGRVKTLHPAVFGGILAKPEKAHRDELKKHDIDAIDLVCVNLYPFADTISKPKIKLAEAIEQIDIGGVTLLRAAAKNFARVTVVANPARYDEVSEKISKKKLDAKTRQSLAAEAFSQTARYDQLISSYLGAEQILPVFGEAEELRYGENPHQQAWLYREFLPTNPGVAGSEVLQGKALSFNNLVDAQVALGAVADFKKPTASVIKHACPCGIASAAKIETALKNALDADKKSPFGGIIALNRPCDKKCAELISPIFMEVVIAPSFTADARKILAKKKNLRLLEVGKNLKTAGEKDVKKVSGGLLVQSVDGSVVTEKDLKCVTKKQPSRREIADLVFAANCVKHVKSNAIVLARDGVTVGIGAGQTARVDAVEIAKAKAGTRASGSVMASDAFFPFGDSVEAAAAAGVTAIIQPGGSIRDEESIRAADAAGIAMVFSGVRAFRH